MAKGILVVSELQEAGAAVSMTLALMVAKFSFEQELSKDFEDALSAACEWRTVTIVNVAFKPFGFRGGSAEAAELPFLPTLWLVGKVRCSPFHAPYPQCLIPVHLMCPKAVH